MRLAGALPEECVNQQHHYDGDEDQREEQPAGRAVGVGVVHGDIVATREAGRQPHPLAPSPVR